MAFDKLMTTYSIGKTNKLIDLNGDKTNFMCSFRCESENGDDFLVAVADQTTLDNEDTLNYSQSKNGVISKTFTSDNNIYQNHFLALKADSPCDLTVHIDLKELPKKMPSEEEVRKLEMIKRQFDREQEQEAEVAPPPTESKYNWTRIFLFCLVGIGLVSVVYYLYNKNKNNKYQEVDLDLDKKINDILNDNSVNDLLHQPEVKSPLRVEDLSVKSYSPDVIPSPIRSPSPISYSHSPDSPITYSHSPASPENTISKSIHEKLMDKLKKASIAY
jgi:hypothetical protein